VGNIVGLLSKEFIRLVLIAFVLTTPLAWFALRYWLQDYPYRIDLEWWMFALTGGAALLIALLTVSYQSIKVALGDPVKSLKSE
jgi:putative ABC transport system permease protein